MHLTQGQHGAYLMLLRWIYTTDKPLQHKHRYSIARAMTEQEQVDTDFVLGEFFECVKDCWYNHTAEEIKDDVQKRHDKRVSAGQMGGIAKASNAKAKPENCHTSHSHNHTKLAGKDEIQVEEELPSEWHTHAERKGIPDEQIYKSWTKFKDKTSHPYRLNNWLGWIERERIGA